MDMGNGTGPGMSGAFSGGGDEMMGMGGGGDVMTGMVGGEVTEMSPEVRWIFEMAWYGETVRDDGLICEEHPPKLSSDGIWEKLIVKTVGLYFWQYRLPKLEIVILLVFFLWQAFNILFKKLRLSVPKFSSMMLVSSSSSSFSFSSKLVCLATDKIIAALKAGLLLNVVVTLSGDNSLIGEILVTKNRVDIAALLGSFGFLIFWFLKGVKMDVKRIFKAEAKARVTGVASVTFPILVGFFLYSFKSAENRPLSADEYDIMLLMESITSFSGIARLLRDLGMNHSSIGRVALSSALVSDIVGLLLLVANVSRVSKSFNDGLSILFEISLFIVIAFAAVRPLMFKVIKRKREGRPIEDKYIYGILVLVSLSCMYWEDLGQFPPLGAFFLGLAIPNGPPIGSALVERLESFNFGIILPLYLSAIMLRTDITSWKGCLTFFSSDDKKFAVASLILLIFLLKLSVSVIVPYLYKMPLRDSIILALIMSHKGIIELSFYLFSYSLVVSLSSFDS